MDASIANGTPVNPPIWWIDPYNEDALKVNDGKINYTLFDKILIDFLLLLKNFYWGRKS